MGGSTVWLVGMMGAGKTVVGRLLAERRGVTFVDTDAEIESATRTRVSEIFSQRGEAGFRRLEREAIERIAGRPAVVALGGGAIAQPGMTEVLAETGTVVYLRTRVGTLMQRLGEASDRPLLAGLDAGSREERIRALLAEREIHYGSAKLVVDSDEGSPEEVAQRVDRALTEVATASDAGQETS